MGPSRSPCFARPIVTQLGSMPQLRIVTAASATVEQMHFSLSIKAQLHPTRVQERGKMQEEVVRQIGLKKNRLL